MYNSVLYVAYVIIPGRRPLTKHVRWSFVIRLLATAAAAVDAWGRLRAAAHLSYLSYLQCSAVTPVPSNTLVSAAGDKLHV